MAPVNLSNLEVKSLFESWGFQPTGCKGGHLVMEHADSGRSVQISAPGRRDGTPMRALNKAANVVGVSLHEFRAGPPPTGTGRPSTPTATHRPSRPNGEGATPAAPHGAGRHNGTGSNGTGSNGTGAEVAAATGPARR